MWLFGRIPFLKKRRGGCSLLRLMVEEPKWSSVHVHERNSSPRDKVRRQPLQLL